MGRFFCLAMIVACGVLISAQARLTKTLDIYVVDVEGGNATLVVSPSGESLLIDAGNGGMGAPRDAGRIVKAARDAGLAQIDPAERDAGCTDAPPPARFECAASAGTQRARVLDQGVRAGRRDVHGDECPQRFLEGVPVSRL